MKNDNNIQLLDWVKTENGFQHTYPNSLEKNNYFYLNGMFIENSNVYDLM